MTNNRDLLKEAIADAKAVKETAIANAKAALEEAFTPMMQEKFARKIAQLDEEDETEMVNTMKEESRKERAEVDSYEYEKGKKAGKKMEEANDNEGYEGQMGMKKLGTKEMEEADEVTGVDEMDLEELLRELDAMEEDQTINLTSFPDEPGEHGNVAGQNVNEAEEMEYEDEDADGVEDSEDEEVDIENMSEDDLKSFIEGVIADMVSAGELEGGHEGMENEEGEEEGEEEESSEEEININELMNELMSGLNERKKYGGNKGDVPAAKRGKIKKDTAEEEGVEDYKKKKLKEGLLDFLKKKKAEAPTKPSGPKLLGVDWDGNYIYDDDSRLKEVEAKLEEAYAAMETVKTDLNEVNLLNAKLLYTNKIFRAKNLTESQKVKVLAAFDKAATTKEAKLVYETLSEGLNEKKSSVNESMIGGASKVAGIAPTKKPILEVNNQFARWQTLAGITK
jgi:hypothetical protein